MSQHIIILYRIDVYSYARQQDDIYIYMYMSAGLCVSIPSIQISCCVYGFFSSSNIHARTHPHCHVIYGWQSVGPATFCLSNLFSLVHFLGFISPSLYHSRSCSLLISYLVSSHSTVASLYFILFLFHSVSFKCLVIFRCVVSTIISHAHTHTHMKQKIIILFYFNVGKMYIYTSYVCKFLFFFFVLSSVCFSVT